MLDKRRKQKLLELFAEGVELAPAERAAFIEQNCAGDAELQAELISMLEVPSDQVDSFLAEPLTRLVADAADAAEGPPPVIPGYVDLEPIGEGGMGMVYRAEQVAPVRRPVALKLIRLGLDTRQVLARFDAERDALARMAHPYIAVVHDAGTDDSGRPYLAMEYVDGIPLTHYCRKHQLELPPLLELFLKISDAVDHAHRRGVLHRDLKPSNVLVVHDDDQPTPKVIDFGIAKALDGSLGEGSVQTLHGAMLGTPEYMSPEQFEGDSRLVDTRTDVYSLGVMLYEILCGELPFDFTHLRKVGMTELARTVREETPPRPSTRLQGHGNKDSDRLTTLRWTRQLHSDLDWVVMKALEKDPERRYPTPRALADDLRRFLNHQPIEAGPPSGLYRMRKFARRYRIQLTAALLVVAALTVGLFGTLWFLMESQDNEANAIASAREAEGTRLAATAALVAERNPNLALLLAVEAAERTDDFSVNETILSALPRHNLVARLQHSDYGTTKARFLAVHFDHEVDWSLRRLRRRLAATSPPQPACHATEWVGMADDTGSRQQLDLLAVERRTDSLGCPTIDIDDLAVADFGFDRRQCQQQALRVRHVGDANRPSPDQCIELPGAVVFARNRVAANLQNVRGADLGLLELHEQRSAVEAPTCPLLDCAAGPHPGRRASDRDRPLPLRIKLGTCDGSGSEQLLVQAFCGRVLLLRSSRQRGRLLSKHSGREGERNKQGKGVHGQHLS